MNQFEEMMGHISNNNKVPECVWEKLDNVLNDLPDYEEGSRVDRRGRKLTAAAAAVMVMGAVLFYANPALAAKIPFIGRIFREVENEVSFSGNYSERAGILAQMTDKSEEMIASAGIVREDRGIKVTASEVYCDGLSIFLTAQVEAEQGGLKNIPGHYTGSGDAAADTLYLQGNWKLSGSTLSVDLCNSSLEGKVVDDHTFVGMLKLDLEDFAGADGELELCLSGIGWDDVTKLDAQDISASHRIEGEWDFDIPFTVDMESAKEISDNHKAE